MALKLVQLESTFAVILKFDSALDYEDEKERDEAYDKYLESGLDESLLKFKDGDAPTKFVMRKTLPWGLAKKIEDEKVMMSKGEMQIKMSFMAEEVRCSLVDILNPPHVPEDEQIKYVRHSDGGASEKILEKLMALGVVPHLFSAKKAVTEKFNNISSLKKS
jgi:hypothetical protein